MSEKRRDSKGRILRTGESQRKDGRYQYRYVDVNGERRCIYEIDLQELRKKVKEIEKQLEEGVSYFDGSCKLSEQIDRMFSLKRKWRDSTRATMSRYLSLVKKSRLYNMPLNKVTITDCKKYCIQLHDEGYSFGTIASVHTLLKMAFQMACEDNAIMRNPCSFSLKSVIDDDTPKVKALTTEQEESLFAFLRSDTFGQRHLDMITVLIGTGIRISEFAALTIKDIDFDKNVIHVNKQIVRLVGSLSVTQPKTKSAVRDIPMTKAVQMSARRLLMKRHAIKKDVMIDGVVGFLSVTRNGRPRTHAEYADAVRKLIARYNEVSDIKIDRCTPHVFRHTFCTKCIAAGMDVKSVQYLMGHSDAGTTLNVYTDNVFEKVEQNMEMLEISCN